MGLRVAWRAEKLEDLEEELEEYQSDGEPYHDMEFENGNERVSVDDQTVSYSGPGGELYNLLEKRNDLEVRIEEENTVEYPFGITD